MTNHTKTSAKYSAEVRERAVRMVFDHAGDYPSQWAAIESVAAKIGSTLQIGSTPCAMATALQERSWPTVQHLWDGHPMLAWFADRAKTFFHDHAAPVTSLAGRLAPARSPSFFTAPSQTQTGQGCGAGHDPGGRSIP